MSKYKENQCDRLVQQIATLVKSQWSGMPSECGHHMIRRANLLWRWRLINIAPLTFEEHGMLHAGLLDPLAQWQKDFVYSHRNRLLERHLSDNHIGREDFINAQYEYLQQVKSDLEHGKTTWDKIIAKEREQWED